MTVSDPIADMLNRIRNAAMAKQETVLVPASKIKLAIAKILKDEGFVSDYEMLKDEPHQSIKIHLKYGEKKTPMISGLKRVSKPGLKVYAKHTEIPHVYGDMGIAILSTSQGVMTGKQAWHQKVSGEVLCYVW